ncbi:MAG: hypothetical protein SGJ27_11290 [Candidatus Melainabacteria bacterium]|nr:hypothetical protein [Candidatus Melainabacteria bacterium]
MPNQSDNQRSGLGSRQITSVMLASFILLSQTVSLAAHGAASDASSKPVLKAIDPSQAKMDTIPKPQAPPSTLNPMGGIQGAPISANKPGALPGQSPPGWVPYQQGGYPAPAYGQQGGYAQPQYQQPAYAAAPPGYPTGAPTVYPPAQGGYQSGYPASPQGYPSYPPQQQQYGYGQAPPQQPPNYGYGQQPAYGAPATSPPGYPSMPASQPSYSNYSTPPGFVQPGANTYQQRPPGSYQQPPAQNAYQQPAQNGYQQPAQNSPPPGNFPAGRARLGGGHPNLVPQGTPPQSGPQSTGGFSGGGFSNNPGQQGGGYQQPPGFVQSQPQGYSQGGYPPQSSPGYPQQAGYGGAAAGGQFASNNYPSPNLIPDFDKPLPLDASSRGPAQMWTTNQVVPAGGNPGMQPGSNPGTGYGAAQGAPPTDPNEARVARLEKVAFGSTYPEHEVEDRVDHLEKEIFGDKSTADLQSRLIRLENKLGGGNSFGSPMRSQSRGQFGGYGAGGYAQPLAPSMPGRSNFVAQSQPNSAAPSDGGLVAQSQPALIAPPVAAKATELALKAPDDPNGPGSAVPPGSTTGSSDDDDATTTPTSSDDASASPDEDSGMPDTADDDSTPPPSDTTDGVSTPAGRGAGSTDLKAMASGSDSPTASATGSASDTGGKSAAKKFVPKIPYDKSAGDYADRISRFVNNSTARWTNFPVRVRLPEDGNADWKKLMDLGMEKWGRYLPLKKATAAEGADIEVSFVNHLTPRVLGVTRLTVTGGKMKVFVFMLRPNYYPSIPEKVLAHAFLHELGHALGIFGHSDKPTDAMSTFEMASAGSGKLTQDKLGSLSTRDVNTLKVIYDANPLPEDFNMTAPQEWGYVHEPS